GVFAATGSSECAGGGGDVGLNLFGTRLSGTFLWSGGHTMRLVKRTYVLPPKTIEEFEKTVSAGDRSAVIADLLASWLENRQREQRRQAIIEGCREMAEIYCEIEGEDHPLEEEVQRALDNETPAGGNRPGPTRPRRRSGTGRHPSGTGPLPGR